MKFRKQTTAAGLLLVIIFSVITLSLAFAPLTLAATLSSQLDAAFAAQDLPRLHAIIKTHPNPSDQAAIVQSVERNLEKGQAPDHFALAMAIASLRNGNLDETLTYLAYYRELVFIDGLVCPDQESPASLLEGTIFLFSRLDHDKSIALYRKERAVDRALDLEASTSAARRIDPEICGARTAGSGGDLAVKLPYIQVRGWGMPTSPYAESANWRAGRSQQLPGMRSFLLQFSGVTSDQ